LASESRLPPPKLVATPTRPYRASLPRLCRRRQAARPPTTVAEPKLPGASVTPVLSRFQRHHRKKVRHARHAIFGGDSQIKILGQRPLQRIALIGRVEPRCTNEPLERIDSGRAALQPLQLPFLAIGVAQVQLRPKLVPGRECEPIAIDWG